MSANFYDLLKYAATGIASPEMTYFDKMRALSMAGGGTIKTLTGIPPLSFTGNGKPLISLSMLGNAQQTGTPSPDNIIMPTFCGVRTGNLFDSLAKNANNGYIQNGYLRSDGSEATSSAYHTSEYIAVSSDQSYTLVYGSSLNAPSVCFYDSSKNFISGIAYGGRYTVLFTTPQNAAFLRLSSTVTGFEKAMLNTGGTDLPYEPYGWKIPLTCAGQTVPVYLGEVPTVRRIMKLVLTGEERWSANTTAVLPNIIMYMPVSDSLANTIPICTHYIGSNTNTWAGLGVDKITVSILSGGVYRLAINAGTATLADFKSYLAAQYAAGTPVTIWYVLAEPETAIVNEPLAKIGGYADELHSSDAAVTIPTANGDNTLTVDTDLQPSSMTIRYKADE